MVRITAAAGQPMNDLRTRVAKAIAGAVYGHNTLETDWADLHEDAQDEYFAEADAVIAELKLQPHDHHYNIGYNRYITGWLK